MKEEEKTVRAELYPIKGPWPGQLAIAPRPRPGDWLEEEIHDWQSYGVNIVVSLLPRLEVSLLGLDEEATLCQVHGIKFISFPITDGDVPLSRRATLKLVTQLERALAEEQ